MEQGVGHRQHAWGRWLTMRSFLCLAELRHKHTSSFQPGSFCSMHAQHYGALLQADVQEILAMVQ